MKRKFKYLFAIFLCPFILSACTLPSSYTITANYSDGELGVVKGDTMEAKEEGSEITLEAIEKKPETNPFICWIKNGRSVISIEKTLKLTYDASTAGSYTAVFEEDNYNKMRYASLTQIDCQPEGYSNISFKLSVSAISSGSTSYTPFIEGSINNGESFMTDNTKICYLGSADGANVYRFQISFELGTGDNPDKFIYVFNNTLNDSLFDDSGICTITENLQEINTDIKLTFNKLTYSLYHQQ